MRPILPTAGMNARVVDDNNLIGTYKITECTIIIKCNNGKEYVNLTMCKNEILEVFPRLNANTELPEIENNRFSPASEYKRKVER